MRAAIAWFARNHVAANLLMGLFVIGGLTALPRIPLKSFPDIDVDMITVAVSYLGAAPEESEAGVCIRIEEEIESVAEIEKLRSTAVEGACVVVAELISGSDVGETLDEIKNRVDAIDTFPEETEKPIISQVKVRRAVVDLALAGDADERGLKILGERVRDELVALPGITQVELTTTRPYEISIEVPEESLRRHGLSFDQVAAAVRRSSLDLPGGSIKTQGGEVLLRTKGQAYRGEEFEKLVVLTRSDGTRVTLGELAEVVDGFADVDLEATFDGRRAVIIRVFRVGPQNTLDISDAVVAYVAEAGARLPEGMTLTVWKDQSLMLRDRLNTLAWSGATGYFLVLLLLALFLRPRLALWVSLGVPIALLGSLALMPALGVSINSISTFAFILVLGILVDDAIVVGENVHTHQQRVGDRLQAAIAGTHEVYTPVVFGVLTTVVAFCPMLFIPGTMGQILGLVGLMVIVCLIFSLVESQLVLPAHLSHGRELVGRAPRSPVLRALSRLQLEFADWLERFVRTRYRRFLRRAADWRYTTVATGLALLMLATSIVASGRMQFAFFPPLEADYVSARLTMPQGTPADMTAQAVRQIVDAVPRLRAELDPSHAPAGGSLVQHVMTSVGEQPSMVQAANNPQEAGRVSTRGSHLAEVTLELLRSEERDLRTTEIVGRWRELVGPVPDAVELVYASSLFSVGEAIHVELRGERIEDLQAAASRVKAELASYPGVIDIADSFRAGKRELVLDILPSAEALGLTLRDLARQVRQAFYGEEAQRIQRGRDDVRVMVRYPAEQRRSLGAMEDMWIRAPDGTEVPFRAVARAELGRGFSSIRRVDRQRVVSVTADVDRNQTTANEVMASLRVGALAEVLADYPGMTYRVEGAQREQARAISSLPAMYILALFAIYALLAVPLGSYGQPLIIMSVIPFALVGAVVGHLIAGRPLSFMSVMGIVAASGVVVNSSLVLVHYVNSRRAAGVPDVEAVLGACEARFRPIVLTSLTTFVGLTPLMLNRSVQAQFLVPMAVSLAFGVLFSTFVTLLLVPSAYLILEDLRRQAPRLRARLARRASPLEVPAAPPAPAPPRVAAGGAARRQALPPEGR